MKLLSVMAHLQVGEAALGKYRSNRSSQSQNAAILRRAVRDVDTSYTQKFPCTWLDMGLGHVKWSLSWYRMHAVLAKT